MPKTIYAHKEFDKYVARIVKVDEKAAGFSPDNFALEVCNKMDATGQPAWERVDIAQNGMLMLKCLVIVLGEDKPSEAAPATPTSSSGEQT